MEADTLLVIVVTVAAANLLFSLFVLIRLVQARRDAAQHRQQQDARLHEVYRATGLLYDRTRQMLELDSNMVRELGSVSSAAQQMMTADRALASKLETVGSQTAQMLQLDQAVSQEIGIVREATRHILTIKDEIADLQGLLQSSRKRGRLGEVLLSALLEDVLPPAHYTLQHPFVSGARADAVVRLDQSCIAVDSKFPLSSYERILDSRDDGERAQLERQFARDVIAVKYIVPGEGTLDFALMFIPSEAVYYEIVTHNATTMDGKTLITYAFERRVFPVSPSTFYPYLLTIARGLRQLYVADNVRKTIGEIAQLEQELVLQTRKWETARKQIDDARRNFGEVQASLDLLHDKILQIITPGMQTISERAETELPD
jgi:DNA recombination protein RmuC